MKSLEISGVNPGHSIGLCKKPYLFLIVCSFCKKGKSTSRSTAANNRSNNNSIHVLDVHFFTAIPVLIVSPEGSVIPNFIVSENDGPVEVCVQAITTAGMLERVVTVILSTQNGTALGNCFGPS